jgi:hypothetical protein
MARGVQSGAHRIGPAHGTLRRQVLLLMLRPQGARISELPGKSANQIGSMINGLQNDYLYDVRMFTNKRSGKKGRPTKTYYVVGKWSRSGRYRSFVDLAKLELPE